MAGLPTLRCMKASRPDIELDPSHAGQTDGCAWQCVGSDRPTATPMVESPPNAGCRETFNIYHIVLKSSPLYVHATVLTHLIAPFYFVLLGY